MERKTGYNKLHVCLFDKANIFRRLKCDYKDQMKFTCVSKILPCFRTRVKNYGLTFKTRRLKNQIVEKCDYSQELPVHWNHKIRFISC
ncbi:Hypothetical predicted protein [Podarcis lilfordi]|uniref:Uncharacterized protein n=1 Tax=Podarcis lilfordi TaxID=74358 RepID=A0AA35PEW3_9SAUR|nr:Hypothetical predicted protein [Podarcis lilfordi]